MLLFLILFTFKITKIEINNEKIILQTFITLEREFLQKNGYNLKGDLFIENKKIGYVQRFSRIYPCKKNLCSYDFDIEIETKNIKKEDFLGFLSGKNLKIELNLNKINKKEEIKILKEFLYSIDLENYTELEMEIIKIEEISLELKEKPQIKFNLILKNPFNFKLKIKNLRVEFLLENQKIEENFKIYEEMEKGEKVFPLQIPIKSDLLISILARKFMEEDLSGALSPSWKGDIFIEIEDKIIKVPFEK